mgnify:CR=1 FL=1
MSPSRAIPILLCLTGLMAGCAGMAPMDDAALDAVESPYLDDAGAALRLGDPDSALTLLRMAAADVPEPAATGLRMEAALLALRGDDPSPARRLLDTRHARSGPGNSALATLLEVELGALEGATAITRLEAERGQLPPRLEPYRLDQLARLQAARGNWREALGHRLALAASDAVPDLQRHNEARLWNSLQQAPLPALQSTVSETEDAIYRGWLALAIATRTRALEPDSARTALAGWRRDYPNHPASSLLATRIMAMQRADLSPPRRVAVLLPVTGDLGAAGRAIRRGLLAAYHADDNTSRRPELLFIDTGAQGLPMPAAYRQAIDQGASQIIGPLGKNALRDLIASTSIRIPVLALNRVDDVTIPEGILQFGLAPEDDARAAAALALRLGHGRMTALGSADDWGRRVVAAFAEHFRDGGGRLLERAVYPPDQEDMSGVIRRLFNLDRSDQRHERLQRLTGLRLSFEDRRRQDMDAVFVAAFEPAARLAVPQIRFQRGIGLPVLATTQAYPQTPQPAADNDLEGVMLTRMPWLLNANRPTGSMAARRQLEAAGDSAPGRLAALGVDAYRLLGPQAILAREPTLHMDGASGRLRIDDAGRVRRHLLPVRIGAGGPQPLEGPESSTPYLP